MVASAGGYGEGGPPVKNSGVRQGVNSTPQERKENNNTTEGRRDRSGGEGSRGFGPSSARLRKISTGQGELKRRQKKGRLLNAEQICDEA